MKKTYNINICDQESWIFIENKMFNQISQWINILVSADSSSIWK